MRLQGAMRGDVKVFFFFQNHILWLFFTLNWCSLWCCHPHSQQPKRFCGILLAVAHIYTHSEFCFIVHPCAPQGLSDSHVTHLQSLPKADQRQGSKRIHSRLRVQKELGQPFRKPGNTNRMTQRKTMARGHISKPFLATFLPEKCYGCRNSQK